MRKGDPLGRPDFVGALGLSLGFLLFLFYWEAGFAALILGYILRVGYTGESDPHRFGQWQTRLSLALLALFVTWQLWNGFNPWQFLTLGLVVWLYLRLSKKRIVTLHIALPDGVGTTIRLEQTPVRLFAQSRAWERRGSGAGVLLGKGFGNRWSVGVGGWGSKSTMMAKECFEGYIGSSVLTERCLVFVDSRGITRAAVALEEVVASTLSADSERKLVVSYGRGIPKTLVLEYLAKGKGEAARIASQWYRAVSSSLTEIGWRAGVSQ